MARRLTRGGAGSSCPGGDRDHAEHAAPHHPAQGTPPTDSAGATDSRRMGGAADSTLILPNKNKINREVFHKTSNCNEVLHENLKILVIVISLRDFFQSIKNYPTVQKLSLLLRTRSRKSDKFK